MLTFSKVSLFLWQQRRQWWWLCEGKSCVNNTEGKKKLLEKLVLARTAITHMKYVKACRVSEKDDDEDILHYSILLMMLWESSSDPVRNSFFQTTIWDRVMAENYPSIESRFKIFCLLMHIGHLVGSCA